MSLEEVRRSSLLAGLDVLLFFSSSLLATRFWLETRSRMREFRRLHLDRDSLTVRCLFLQLLSAANALRAFGIVLDANLRLIFERHKHHLAWRRWLDYLSSSLPTLLWSSMLSVLLLYIIEIYHKSQLQRAPLLRPTFAFLNGIFYLLYSTFAGLTLHLSGPTYKDFRRMVYFLLAGAHAGIALGILRYGLGLAWRLRQ
eukprot:CAMPEP_0198562990 /NCGR_PEP_ID=MMETSP1462-20131121/98030_1 /TAXON_ID=1333877 /ORGANISM="Brandtodinium nutriculum, Strain RCC3387" /LENGTH=198 /DNA_ID=CAMNT_0044293929 /DNA_START=18 /DNA_END=611 /DNA_ORIENTATION=+